jgi:cytochrome c oxidase subunit 2
MHIDKYERIWMIMAAAMLGVFFASLVAGAVIFGVRPTQSDGFINPMLLQDSEFANPGVRHMGTNQYEAIILARAWSFSTGNVENGLPVIRVPEGADVTFKITSEDVIHGFYIEETTVNLEVIPGQVSVSRHIFDEAGEFAIQCNQYCGRNHHGMYGWLIVEEETVTAKD